MEGIVRRPSGVYVARLMVPRRLRPLVGKTELIATTGVRDAAVARIVGGQLLMGWRLRFLELERMLLGGDIDVMRALSGSPQLALGGHLPLAEAAIASGIPQDTLLRLAADRKLHLYLEAHRSTPGHRLGVDELEVDIVDDEGIRGRVIPTPGQMPDAARRITFTGVLAVPDSATAARGLLTGGTVETVVFAIPGGGRDVFVPDDAVVLTRENIRLSAADVERHRKRVAQIVTPDQIESAKAVRASIAVDVPPQRLRPLAESIETFLADHKRGRGAEQTQRIRGACQLFLELMGSGLRGADVTRELVREFRDNALPRVPEHENKVRLRFRTHSISASIEAVKGRAWPTISTAQQVKRMLWVSGWFAWLRSNGWIEQDHSEGLAGGGDAGRRVAAARRDQRKQDKRDPFSADDLRLIFGAGWFRTGRGEITAVDTYREWMPYRYWVPLIAALTGARLNEIAQLHLNDVRRNAAGVWLLDIDGVTGPSDGSECKRLKNVQSRRQIPLHSALIRLGLDRWVDTLRAQGTHERLFPELSFSRHDASYGNAVTKWFSPYLKSIGVHEHLRKVFHSFRHTVADQLVNRPGANSAVVSQILGHERGRTTTETTYRKDVDAIGPDHEIVKTVEALGGEFLDLVAPFDIEAGLQALRDAIRRKNRGRGER